VRGRQRQRPAQEQTDAELEVQCWLADCSMLKTIQAGV
jgi:hypothetical protein